MDTLQKLMQYDAGKLETIKGNVKIKLRKLGGEEFDFPIVGLDAEFVAEMQEEIINISVKKKSGMKIDVTKYSAQLRTIVEGCPSIFKNGELQKRFGAKTPTELVEKLMTAGEMDKLSGAIEDLTGYDEDDEEEIKN